MRMQQIRDFMARHGAQDPEELFDYNSTTGKYHRQSCKYHGHESTRYTLAEIKEFGATACAVCKPPAYAGYVEG